MFWGWVGCFRVGGALFWDWGVFWGQRMFEARAGVLWGWGDVSALVQCIGAGGFLGPGVSEALGGHRAVPPTVPADEVAAAGRAGRGHAQGQPLALARTPGKSSPCPRAVRAQHPPILHAANLGVVWAGRDLKEPSCPVLLWAGAASAGAVAGMGRPRCPRAAPGGGRSSLDVLCSPRSPTKSRWCSTAITCTP